MYPPPIRHAILSTTLAVFELWVFLLPALQELFILGRPPMYLEDFHLGTFIMVYGALFVGLVILSVHYWLDYFRDVRKYRAYLQAKDSSNKGDRSITGP